LEIQDSGEQSLEGKREKKLPDAEFVEKNLDAMLESIVSSMPCQFPSKRYRLECLYHLFFLGEQEGQVPTDYVC
jgi:hypothetical protein